MKKTVSILIISLLVTSGFVIFINFEPKIIASGKTLYVGGWGPGNWTDINQAIWNASDGDTVFVYKGYYLLDNSVGVFKKIKLIGEDRELTILDGSDGGNPCHEPISIIVVNTDDVTITGFNITRLWGTPQAPPPENGIYLWGASNCKIYNNIISQSFQEINLENSGNNFIYDNIINDGLSSGTVGTGIAIISGNGNSIYHNNFYDHPDMAYDLGSSNSWDNGYPSGGNYWDDYSPTAPDLYSGSITPQTSGSPDGICDTPYNVDSNTKDFYPLKNPFINTSSPPSAPTGLLATRMGNGWVNFTWTAAREGRYDPVTSYRIYRGLESNEETFLAEIGYEKFYNDTDVTNGITYYYKVSAINSEGEGPLSEELSVTPLAAPTIPTGLKAVTGDSFIEISWDPPESNGGRPVTAYNIYRGVTSGEKSLLTEIGNIITFNDTEVTNGITYFYNVSAVNEIGEGPLSVELSATPWATPTMPTKFAVKAGDSFAYLTWDEPDSDGGFIVSNYRIYKSLNPNADEFYLEIGNVLYYNDTDVDNGNTYYYGIGAMNIKGEGLKSQELTVTPGTVPSAPLNLMAKNGDSWVYLIWNAPNSDGGVEISKYELFRGEISSDLDYFGYTNNELSFNDTSAVNNITYYYQIKALNSIGESPFSNQVSATPKRKPIDDTQINDSDNNELAPPTAPLNLQAYAGNDAITLTWEPPLYLGSSPIINYNIYRGTASGEEIFLIKIENITNYLDTGLVNNQTYHYFISAVNSVGEGLRSNGVSATPTSAPTVPYAPQDVKAVSGIDYIALTWDPPDRDGGSPIITYTLFRRTVSSSKYLLFDVGNVLAYNDTGLTNGQTYYYRISAVNSIGEGPRSNEVSVMAGNLPDTPLDLSIESGDSYLKITWTPPKSDGGSPIRFFLIYKGTAPDNLTYFQLIENELYFYDTDVTNGSTYYYKVSAITKVGEGPLSVEANGSPQSSLSTTEKTQKDQAWWIWPVIIIIIIIVILLAFLILFKKKILPPRRRARHSKKVKDDITEF